MGRPSLVARAASLVGIVLAMLLALPPARAADEASTAKKQVLLVTSYGKGFHITAQQAQGVEEVFSGVFDAELRIEFLDTQRLPSAHHARLLKTLFELKYKDSGLALVIAADEAALQQVLAHRDKLFPGLPVVFCGVRDLSRFALSELHGVTGVRSGIDFVPDIRLILQLHPAATRIGVIVDETGSGRRLREAFEQAASEFRERVAFDYLTAVDLAAMRQRVSARAEQHVLYYLSFADTALERPMDASRILSQLSLAASAPLYGGEDYMLGYGIVGGHLRSAFEEGKAAAVLARRILQGAPVSQLPVQDAPPGRPMFDFRELHRFGMALGDLPSGSVITNQPDTFWYRYKHFVWPVILLFVLMLVYIGTLRFNIGQRKKAQRGLRHILEQSGELFDLECADAFGKDLRARLTRLLPKDSRIAMYKYRGDGERFAAGQLLPIAAQDETRSPPQALVAEALRLRRNVQDACQYAIYFDKPAMPISLAWVQTPAALDEIERQLLEIWSSHVATSIDNVEKYKLMDSLEHARKIQESMLPTDFAGAGARFAVDVYARLTPAKEVSGDLYDVFAVQDGGLCLLVGDVSDKGVPSALFMAMTRTLIRSAMKTERAPQRVLRRVNQELCQDNDMAMFVTLFLAIYYPDNGQLVYANAGHNPPYVLRGGGAIELIPSHEDIALGVLPDIDYAQAELSLQRGDGLLLFTDGVTEACDIDAQLFGETRLERALQDLHQAPAEAVVNGVFDRVGAFVRGAAQSDDTTVLCLRRRSV